VGLERVWIATGDGGLVRADHVMEVVAHKTAPFAGKSAHWLVDVVTATNQGAGFGQQWNLGASHRTLIQTDEQPHGVALRLTQLLAALHTAGAAGIVTAHRVPHDAATAEEILVDFRFELFAPPPGLREHLDGEPAGPEATPRFL
jgi:hypothetical protein